MARKRPPFQTISEGDGPPLGPWIRIAPIVLILLIALYVVWKGFYVVAPTERAVVLRFGKIVDEAGPGLNFLIPFVDQRLIVDMSEQTMRLPFGGQTGDRVPPDVEEPGLMLTGELNAAVVEWDIQYRVKDPKKFLFQIAVEEVKPTIQAAAQSVMHRLIGDYSIDEVLTSQRETVSKQARESLQQLLDSYDAGIEIAGLQMQRITAPDSVRAAYDEVNSAMQTRERLINDANRERNQLIPTAQATRDRAIREAEGYASAKKLTVDGEVAALKLQYEQYRAAPEITRRRMYLEALEEVFSASGTKIFIDADLKGLLPMLDLEGRGSGNLKQ